MNCEQICLRVHDYLDGGLSLAIHRQVEQHLDQCDKCDGEFKNHIRIKTLLKSMPRVTAAPHLTQQILLQRGRAAGKSPRDTWVAFTSMALAASLLLAVLLLPSIYQQPGMPMDVAQSNIHAQINQPSQVNFLVNAKHAFEKVTFSLTVPPEMALYGYTGKQTLSWMGKLKQGNNLLSIPVVALTPKSGVLVMTIQHEGISKAYKVHVDVKNNNVLVPISSGEAYT